MGKYYEDQAQRQIIGYNLEHLITSSGKDQKQISIEIDVNPPTFNQWVNGKAMPSVSALKKLAEYFNVPLTSIVDPYTEDVKDLNLTDSEIELIHKYRSAPTGVKDSINILLNHKEGQE